MFLHVEEACPGAAATPAEIAGWNIDVDRDGNNLPPGSGTVGHGHEVVDQQCAAADGAKGCRVWQPALL
jgi:S-disulfanyl-L-cysteine oxidoreductase SoxD